MRVLQGITALIAANILRGTDFAAMERGSVEHYHAMIEAIRCGSPLLSSPLIALIALIDLFCTHTHRAHSAFNFRDSAYYPSEHTRQGSMRLLETGSLSTIGTYVRSYVCACARVCLVVVVVLLLLLLLVVVVLLLLCQACVCRHASVRCGSYQGLRPSRGPALA